MLACLHLSFPGLSTIALMKNNRLHDDLACCFPRNPDLCLLFSHSFQKLKIHHCFIMNYMVIRWRTLWYTKSIDHMVLWDIAASQGFNDYHLFIKTKHSSQPHPSRICSPRNYRSVAWNQQRNLNLLTEKLWSICTGCYPKRPEARDRNKRC